LCYWDFEATLRLNHNTWDVSHRRSVGAPESKTQLTPQTLDEIFPGDEASCIFGYFVVHIYAFEAHMKVGLQWQCVPTFDETNFTWIMLNHVESCWIMLNHVSNQLKPSQTILNNLKSSYMICAYLLCRIIYHELPKITLTLIIEYYLYI
jgi:hypothetical protein